MPLDTLFELLGAHGTSMMLLGILGIVGAAPLRAVLRPGGWTGGWSAVERRVTRRI
jgi:hypothetical protein